METTSVRLSTALQYDAWRRSRDCLRFRRGEIGADRGGSGNSSETVCLARVPSSLAQRRASIKIGLSGSCSYSNDPYTRCRVDLTYMDA